MIIKLTTICIGFILLFTVLPEVIGDSSRKIEKKHFAHDHYQSGLFDEFHVITDPMVPYVGQGNDSYCMYASTTMQIKYYGFNISLPEILHDLGHGYLHGYFRLLPPFRTPFGGSGLSTASFNMELLADGYNLTFNDD